MKGHRDFNTTSWSSPKYVPWPQNLVSVSGTIYEPDYRPATPGHSESSINKSSTLFNRIRMDMGSFLQEWVSRKTSDIGPNVPDLNAEQRWLLRMFQLEALLGSRFSSVHVESERAFSPLQLKHAGVSLKQGWDRLPDSDLDRAWAEILPRELLRGFYPVSSQLGKRGEQRADVLHEFDKFMDLNESKKFETVQKAFFREILPNGADPTPYIIALADTQRLIHRDFNRSILHMLEHENFAITYEWLVRPEATKRELRFYYSSEGPWSLVLHDWIPAMRGCMPTLIAALTPEEHDAFDEDVFVHGDRPRRPVLLKLLNWATAYADGISEVRKYEKKRAAHRSAANGELGRARLHNIVPYNSEVHDHLIYTGRLPKRSRPAGASPD